MNEVFLSSYNETSLGHVFATLRSFGNLRPPYPKCREKFAIVPCFRVSHCPNCCFVESNRADIKSSRIDDYSWSCSWKICMEVDISFIELVFNNLLVLLWVSSWYHKIIFWWDKPIVFFKPKWFSDFIKSFGGCFNLLKLLSCIVLSLFDSFISFLFCSLFLYRTLLFDLIIFLNIHLGW